MARILLPKKRDIKTIRAWLTDNRDMSIEDLARLSGLSVGKIQEWKIKCDVIDPKDERLFKIWVKYKYYSVSEACVILGITPRSYKYYLNKYGVNKYKNHNNQFCKQKPRNIKYEPLEWPIDKVKLKKLLKKYGFKTIAKMANMSSGAVEYRARKFNIKSNEIKPVNKFNNIEWLKDRYFKKKWNLQQCAEEANVASHTIRNWLLFHGLKPRSSGSI